MKINIFKMVAVIAVVMMCFAGCALPDDDAGDSSGTGGGGGGGTPSSSSASGSTRFSAPTGLTAVANDARSVTISWSAVSDATSYRIYRSTSESGDYARVATVTGSLNTSFTNDGVTYRPQPNTIYYYRVTALNGSVESDRSSAASVTTPPAAPGNPRINVDSTASLTVSWGVVSGATVYNVYRSSSQAGDYSKIGTASTNSYTDKNELLDNTQYYYRISAENSGGAESSLSSVTSATTAPNIPTGLTAVADNARSVTISWSAVSGATSYRVYRSSSESGDYVRVATVTGSLNTSFIHGRLQLHAPQPNTIYYYRVTALNGSGEGSRSSAVSVTTPSE
ncbi:MAG: fibronectin type III domain-containing protein [Fibromonadaceae bacterium]|jgi:fibronectin type 3 domain-containing protein|nr:fibronectin type III domain-containing protein [Fibromonadaceae bacterium]